jgi:hypothetical protein
MKYSMRTSIGMLVFIGTVLQPQHSLAQGYGKPLTMQGIDAMTLHSAASRGVGGASFAVSGEASLMFANPASLRSLRSAQITVGGLYYSSDAAQTQQYSPVKYYSNFSLFMEGLTRYIPDPVYDTAVINYTAADTVQRQFDSMEPNWKRSETRSVPVQLFVAAPLEFAAIKISVGVGAAEYANLNWHFQNNNVLSPSILTPNPFVTTRPPNDADSSSIPIQWFQNYQQRKGTIQGYGAVLAMTVMDNVDLGVSAMVLSGSSDDIESRTERGRIRLYQNYFRAESVYYSINQIGTSEYSGSEYTLSGSYRGKFVTAGVSVQLPTTITRSYTGTLRTDTTGLTSSVAVSGNDEITIPMRSTLALSVLLRENITFGFEYGIRPYKSAEYTSAGGVKTTPWISANVTRIGVMFDPADWLTLRAGVRQQAEVFEPEGNPISGEPVGYTVYSAGCGIRFSGIRMNMAYEYSSMKFVDMWAGAVSINTKKTHAIIADVSYELPWGL